MQDHDTTSGHIYNMSSSSSDKVITRHSPVTRRARRIRLITTNMRQRLSQTQSPTNTVLERQQEQENTVDHEAHSDGDHGHNGIQPVVVCRGHDDAKYQAGVGDCGYGVDDLGEGGLAGGLSADAAEDLGVVEECAADDEGVGEVETGHGGELVYGLAVDPDALGVLLADCVEEVVGFGEEARGHAGVDAEGCEGEEVAQGHCAAGDGEDVGVGSFMVVP